MGYKDLVWQVPLLKLQKFNEGAVIDDVIPLEWEPEVGDYLEYELGEEFAGVAQIVGIDPVPVDLTVEEGDDNDPFVVPGVRCRFQKVKIRD